MFERFYQHFLPIGAEKKIDQQQRAIRMLGVREKSRTAGDGGDEIHGDPGDGRALVDRMANIAVNSAERYWDLS